MALHSLEKQFDVVVIGGGMSGICAAIASARNGAKTALVQSRGVLGGNASSEIRMHIVGASCHNSKKNLAESGILLEILLENKRRNPYQNFSIWDSVLWEKVHFQENLTLFLNTDVRSAQMEGKRILSVTGYQNTTETDLTFLADIFIDATGHGTVGVLAGAKSRVGSEGKAEFDEPTAPDQPNTDTMGSTIMFQAVNRGKPVHFEKPHWAYSYTEEDLKHRSHYNCTKTLGEGDNKALPDFSTFDSGYWWLELGGDNEDNIKNAEEIRDELLKTLYGVWDHIKNAGDHGAENYDLEWVGMVPGYRESRRLEGPYLLNENDVRANRIFEDAVAYGAWPMDVHTPGGILDTDKLPSAVYNFEGHYTIPYRCYYSKDVDNLMMAGRNISTSKMAFSSTRVMGTCAIGGQAAGTAAAMAVKEKILPAQVNVSALQQRLLRQDCFIPGFKNQDEKDFAPLCRIHANGAKENCPAENVVNGIARTTEEGENAWESLPLREKKAQITLAFDRARQVGSVQLAFDPNFTREIMPSITSTVRDRQCRGLPDELVKDYTILLRRNGAIVWQQTITENGQRLNLLSPHVEADEMEITVLATHGHPAARIYEIRLYE